MYFFRLGMLIGILIFQFGPADAGSCNSKVVGSWTVRVDATGQTYPAQFLANGRSQVSCPMCTPGGSWSCEGGTVTVHVDNGVTVQHQLQPDGNTMTGGCCTITRLGGARVRDAAVKPQQATRPQQDVDAGGPDVNTLRASQGTCSDITGVGGPSRPTNCQQSSSVPAKIRSQLDANKFSSQKSGGVGAPGSSGKSADVELQELNAAFSAAKDWDTMRALAKRIALLQKRDNCPSIAPEEFWVGTKNEDYCRSANCSERQTAYYGMLCYYKYKESEIAHDDEDKICEEALAKFKASPPSDETLEKYMLHQKIACNPDGTHMTMRQKLSRALERQRKQPGG